MRVLRFILLVIGNEGPSLSPTLEARIQVVGVREVPVYPGGFVL